MNVSQTRSSTQSTGEKKLALCWKGARLPFGALHGKRSLFMFPLLNLVQIKLEEVGFSFCAPVKWNRKHRLWND